MMKVSLGNKTLILPLPALMVGTYDSEGRPDLTTVAWGGICSSEPPSVAISLRPSRYAYRNIVENKEFTVCIPSSAYAAEVDFCGIASGRDRDKFKECGLTAVKHDTINAPVVAEFPMALVCRLLYSHNLGSHTQFVGEIIDVLADEDKLTEKGAPDISAMDPVAYDTAGKGYHKIGERVRGAFLPINKSVL